MPYVSDVTSDTRKMDLHRYNDKTRGVTLVGTGEKTTAVRSFRAFASLKAFLLPGLLWNFYRRTISPSTNMTHDVLRPYTNSLLSVCTSA